MITFPLALLVPKGSVPISAEEVGGSKSKANHAHHPLTVPRGLLFFFKDAILKVK